MRLLHGKIVAEKTGASPLQEEANRVVQTCPPDKLVTFLIAHHAYDIPSSPEAARHANQAICAAANAVTDFGNQMHLEDLLFFVRPVKAQNSLSLEPNIFLAISFAVATHGTNDDIYEFLSGMHAWDELAHFPQNLMGIHLIAIAVRDNGHSFQIHQLQRAHDRLVQFYGTDPAVASTIAALEEAIRQHS